MKSLIYEIVKHGKKYDRNILKNISCPECDDFHAEMTGRDTFMCPYCKCIFGVSRVQNTISTPPEETEEVFYSKYNNVRLSNVDGNYCDVTLPRGDY